MDIAVLDVLIIIVFRNDELFFQFVISVIILSSVKPQAVLCKLNTLMWLLFYINWKSDPIMDKLCNLLIFVIISPKRIEKYCGNVPNSWTQD